MPGILGQKSDVRHPKPEGVAEETLNIYLRSTFWKFIPRTSRPATGSRHVQVSSSLAQIPRDRPATSSAGKIPSILVAAAVQAVEYRISPGTRGQERWHPLCIGENRLISRCNFKMEVVIPAPIFKTIQGVSSGIFVTAACNAAAMSLTYIKSRVCWPSPVT